MKIALLFRTVEIVKNVRNKIKSVLDGAEYFEYVDVDSLIKESNQRRVYFDRVVMSDSVVASDPEKMLSSLSRYISNESDKTQVVFVSSSYNNPSIKVFREIFNSPLYTVVVPERITSQEVTNFVTDDIQDLALKYFDEEKYKAALKKGLTKEAAEPKKSGGLFSRNRANKREQNSGVKEQNNSGVTAESSSSNNGSENNSGDTSKNVSKRRPPRRNRGDENVDSDQNLGDFENDPSGVEGDPVSSENVDGELDELMSMWGDNTIDDVQEQQEPEEPEEEEEDLESGIRKKGNPVEENGLSLDINDMTQIVIFIGERGVGVTTLVTDLAQFLYEKGESVLIVDLDFIRNGILSNINVKEFYARGKENGIDNKNPFSDAEADIISNGYAVPVTKQSVRKLITDRDFINNYDRILIDCPLDCLKNTISNEVIKNNTVYVVIKGDLLSLSATSIGLTDKSVDSFVERYIAENCLVYVLNKMDSFEEDIEVVRDTFYFSNGNWLNNIG